MILSGPFLTGFCQTINDWYDKDLDAINEPYRPIPSGRITEEEVFQQVYFLLFGGLALAFGCDVWAGHNIIANPLNSVGLLACFGEVAFIDCGERARVFTTDVALLTNLATSPVLLRFLYLIPSRCPGVRFPLMSK